MNKNKSKSNVVIITTRWMSIINNEEGEIIPIHCSRDVNFKEKDLSQASKIVEYLSCNPSSHLILSENGKICDKYYHLEETDSENDYHVYIVPCHAKNAKCTNHDEWIKALVLQFSEPGDIVRMLLHASSDYNDQLTIISSYPEIKEREVKIRTYAHSSDKGASVILSRNAYGDNISAAAIFRAADFLCADLSKVRKNFKDAWDSYYWGDIEASELCNAYNEFLKAIEYDLRKNELPPLEEFQEIVAAIDEHPENCGVINQIIAKF